MIFTVQFFFFQEHVKEHFTVDNTCWFISLIFLITVPSIACLGWIPSVWVSWITYFRQFFGLWCHHLCQWPKHWATCAMSIFQHVHHSCIYFNHYCTFSASNCEWAFEFCCDVWSLCMLAEKPAPPPVEIVYVTAGNESSNTPGKQIQGMYSVLHV